jgi:Flp pilus assembly protein TadD
MIHQIVAQLNADNNADALALVEKAITAKPDTAGLRYAKALALARLGQTDKAIETLKQLLTVIPTHQSGRRLLSNIPKN